MKITVFGATGGTGRDRGEQALQAGHTVTAVVRLGRPDFPAGVEVVRADVMDAAAIEPVVTGRDAVISALGRRPGAHEPVCAPGAESIIRAMRATGTRRLVVITRRGPRHTTTPRRLSDREDRQAHPVALPARRRSPTSSPPRRSSRPAVWTGPSCGRPGSPTANHKPYRTAIDHTVPRSGSISRTDLATATLAAAANPATVGYAVAIGY